MYLFYLQIVQFNSSQKIIKFIQQIGDFAWPIPSSSNITSYFGFRKKPTNYASIYHSGIDIAAPEGTDIISVLPGSVIFAGFSGSGGCTIIIRSNNFTISYCHVSPNFIVSTGDLITKGQVISHVGPKNVYGFASNKYIDKKGNPTNGATTGPHLHLSIKKDGIAVNPLNYISYLPSSL